MSKRKGKREKNDIPIEVMDEETIMRAVFALKKTTLNSADFNRIARKLQIPSSQVEKVANEFHPTVRVQRM